MTALWDFLRRLFGIQSSPAPDTSDPCNAASCIDAKKKLQDVRDGFNSVCSGLRTLTSIARALRALLSVPIWILIAVAAVAALMTVLLGGLAIVFWLPVFAYGLAWVLAPVVTRMIIALLPELDKRRSEFAIALNDVVARCPERCRGDLSLVECQLE